MSDLTLTIDDIRALQIFVGRLRDEMARTAVATEGINAGRGAHTGIVIEGVASGTPVPVSGAISLSGAGTSSVTQVGDSASSVQLLAATAGRLQAMFYNDSSAIAYLKLGTTASTSSYTIKMAAGSYFELPHPVYTGRIDCIWASDAGGVMAITELTA